MKFNMSTHSLNQYERVVCKILAVLYRSNYMKLLFVCHNELVCCMYALSM